MARRLKTDPEIDQFIAKVLGEASHHGGNVAKIIQPLSDAVRKRLNLSSDRVEVYERNGNLARTCWVTLSSKRYAFSYNYDAEKIELRDHSIQGQHRFSFDNSTSQSALSAEVAKL